MTMPKPSAHIISTDVVMTKMCLLGADHGTIEDVAAPCHGARRTSFRSAVEYLLSTFAEKYSTWDFYERNSTKTQETICPLNPKYDVIFCVRAKLQGGLCGKARRNYIAYLGKRGQFVPQIDFPRTKKGMFVL